MIGHLQNENNVIILENVYKSFNGTQVLNNVSLNVTRGEVFGYVGPNGAGKTTTIRIILGLLKQNSGKVQILGKNPWIDDNSNNIKQRIGVMLDNPGHFIYTTAFRNLIYYASIYRIPYPEKRVEEVLKWVGLWEYRNQRVETFSKGMKQRLALARAIIHDPEVLVFDEPTTGLDPNSQRMAREFLVHFARKKYCTVFLSSHNLDEVQTICSRVAIIVKGKIVACDYLEKLKEKFSKHVIEILLTKKYSTNDWQSLCNKLRSKPYVLACTNNESDKTLILELVTPEYVSHLNTFFVEQGVPIMEIKRRVKTLGDIFEELVSRGDGAGDFV